MVFTEYFTGCFIENSKHKKTLTFRIKKGLYFQKALDLSENFFLVEV
jgi:hypothetical protein